MISVLKDALFPVKNKESQPQRVGLRELFEQAHEWSDLGGRTSTGRLALLRLCVAFLEDIYVPETLEDRQALLEEGVFDMDRINAYFAACERQEPRFLLDDEAHPFMQMPYTPEMDDKAEKPVATLFNNLPSGNGHVFIEHRPVESLSCDAAEALEGLLETYMFCTAGAQLYPSGINNTPPVYCLIRGRTLFETLVLNMVSIEELPNNIPFGAGMAPWRRHENIVPKTQVSTVSFLEALTWQPRRLTLIFEPDRSVRRVYLQQGKNFIGDGRWRDPWVPYRKRKDGSDASIKPELGRQLWRDAGSILSGQGSGGIMPVPIANVAEIWSDMPERILPVQAVGLITSQASILGASQELLRVPEALLEDEVRAETFNHWIGMTEEIHGVSKKILSGICTAGDADLICECFLRDMRDVIFGEPLQRLAAIEGPEDMRVLNRDVGKALSETLRGNLRRLLENCGTTVDSLKRQNEAEEKTMRYCYKRLKEEGMR